jgi:uncharacterized membrane protein
VSRAGRAWHWARSIHPGLVLAGLDLIGLAVASYLSVTELSGNLPVCGPLHGCQQVAQSPYSRPFAGIPVAVYGVFLSLVLLTLALAWWRTGSPRLLLAHYALSMFGVAFELWFQYAQIFLIGSFCVWCETYGLSLVARFLIALRVYLRRDLYAPAAGPLDMDKDEPAS